MGNADPGPGKGAGNHSFDYIRERLGKIRENTQNTSTNNDGRMSLKAFQKSLNTRPTDPSGTGSPSMVIGGKDNLPETVFGKELREKEWGGIPSSKTGFVNIYSYEVLGQKLRKLRPEAKTADWFSLSELNERLTKLKDIEDEAESTTKGGFFMDLKERLISIKLSEKEKANKEFSQKLDILGHLRRTPSFMLHPPKEHLVEKYFHTDNMSSEEKLKIELAKVRDEFKISESDCGSARVQVAQLTTKIKHLSSVLHKKDKHSRKGLIGMVQRRKKLLKYLRRTDWDSYCFVISKLGLRDNPDFKN
ncbi:30S ribosomal protein S15, chloroplastic [Quillaja saponaria]|uniref:Small ribosomal subunit protein uS15c n=1 Tax=Quillaja saponaria TaxID=32244 RepID=A0AAD7L644_QUISA|nr:30S ribosomal protein S15, chloroplastic [Quillaja saponaria]